jgi:amidase
MNVTAERTPPTLGIPRRWQELCSDDVRASVEAALATLSSAGATYLAVEPVDEAAVFDALLMIVCAEAATSLDDVISEGQYAEVAPPIRALVARGRSDPAVAYVNAHRYRDRLRDDIDTQLSGLDGLVMPSISTVAKRWDAPDLDDWSIARFLPAFNLTGHPAISVPVPVDGLPVAIQVVGHRDADESLLAIAAWIEARFGGAGPRSGPVRAG